MAIKSMKNDRGNTTSDPEGIRDIKEQWGSKNNYNKEDRIRIKCANHYYLKNENIWQCHMNAKSSWYWKRILKIKNITAIGFDTASNKWKYAQTSTTVSRFLFARHVTNEVLDSIPTIQLQDEELEDQMNQAQKQRRCAYRTHGRIDLYMSCHCHIELILPEKEGPARPVSCQPQTTFEFLLRPQNCRSSPSFSPTKVGLERAKLQATQKPSHRYEVTRIQQTQKKVLSPWHRRKRKKGLDCSCAPHVPFK
ncbi:hypothetical protein Cgig2_017477 [Carnegiea gigantea]|uniref:Ribosomal protein L22 n=1 Tax=Carnegiea gigantea TaxID=171969 RepID=A0A9Q1GKX2_9CARY|nr:hypothetical protein Cgig2_017477 [Carnegiea gigantea]